MSSIASSGTESSSEQASEPLSIQLSERNDKSVLKITKFQLPVLIDEKKPPSSPPPPQFKTIIKTPPSLEESMRAWPSDLHDPLALFYTHANKTYLKGYVYIKHELDKEGAMLPITKTMSGSDAGDRGEEWAKWWCELTGECLYLWKVDDEIASLTFKPSPQLAQIMALELEPAEETIAMFKQAMPVSINISDAVVELLPFPYQRKL